ncbi:tail fiber assembly protein [Aeromonas phage 51]|uniref:Tail fiber assembly protein n=3 Tax=Popoffvirus pv56 TaxID=2560283 RepID=A0A219YBH5_9CAUD|nr:tail fiber assembly [Aeromonas phage vB_AsaM-56]AFC22679.1 putative tail-fiber protein [Aeromonas phage vB_AsaM-56]APU01307.1 tail fiber assembly protein [Aeromonas phage 51]APU01391.1 tail fiber assembly protein [Aeromonas phage 56]
MMNEPRVVWGEDGFASVSGWAFAHCVNQTTGELLFSQDIWVVVGTGLPAGAFLENPPLVEDGMAIVRHDGAWVLVEDLRGTTAYNKQTKQSEVINSLGSLPLELTLVAPSSHFDVWNEDAQCWVTDSHSEQDWLTQQATYQRSVLLGEASNEIAALLDALDPEVTSDPDDAIQTTLLEWKQYRAAIAVIDCATHPVQWPQRP